MQQWTLDKIRSGFEEFHKIHGKYPTAHEIDGFELLPSSRQLQRKFGGLPAIRQQLKLGGPIDFTKGDYSSKRAEIIGKRAHKMEKEVYEMLIKRFGRPFVHREYFFTDDRRTRADFYVFGLKQNFLVDVFYPKDRFNLMGCLNSKFRTYRGLRETMSEKVIFLMMNDEISEEEIQNTLRNRKNKLYSNQSLMKLETFKDFCLTVEARAF